MEQNNEVIEQPLPPKEPVQSFENYGNNIRPVRRVGTVTMGITLIAVGVLLLVTLVSGDYSLLWLGRLSPVILVLIGIEIILSFAFSRQRPIKYDFFSVFICLILIFGSIAGSLIPTIMSLSQNQHRTEFKVRQEAEASMDQILKDFSSIKESSVSVYSMSFDFADFTTSSAEMQSEQYYKCTLELELKSQFNEKKAFAKEASDILKAIAPSVFSYRAVVIRCEDGEYSNYFRTDGTYAGKWTEEEILDEITPDD